MSSISKYIFTQPFACLIAGPSQSGKSTLLTKILQQNKLLVTPQATTITYCYARWSRGFEILRTVEPPITFVEGLPDINSFNPQENNILILDDLISQAENNSSIQDLFTTDSHHANISVFLISQNLFSQGRFYRTISLNCQYMLLLNNPRDKAQINHLARQMYPTNPHFLIECYEDATSNQFGYIFIDLKQSTDNKNRVQTGITCDKERIIYQPKN